ncbi:MAG: HD domain-containing protein [Aquificae bacterium]|nr:HD domain-containing protein [Aquificota bacterium]
MELLSFLKPFADALFKLATIRRWNDHPRPFDITELDKQGHKAIVAFLFAKIEEVERGKRVDWRGLIEGLVFEALERALLTDLKPRVFHKVVKSRRQKVNEYLLDHYGEALKRVSPALRENFERYFSDEGFRSFEKHLVGAAHFVPTYWEFQFIYPVARELWGIERTREEIENTLEDFHHLIGIQRFLLKRKLYGFVNLCGKLRFQKRWIALERIPQTSVMGHLFTVFTVVYLLLSKLEASGFPVSERTFYATAFAALFHDLPEIVTRDIISPLKEVLGKEEIRRLEVEGLEEELLPLLPPYLARELRVFLGLRPPVESEFTDRIVTADLTLKGFSSLEELLPSKEAYPIFGSLVKLADHLSAHWEVLYTLSYGLKNDELLRAKEKLEKQVAESPVLKLFEEKGREKENLRRSSP